MQFGMLIEFLFEKFPEWEELGSQAIGDLQVRVLFYALTVLL
jgi:arginyl-tRNA synthetase